MAVLPLENKSNSTLRIMLEPMATEYDIPPGGRIDLSGSLDNLQVDYWEDNFLAIWVTGDVVVLREGKVALPIFEQKQ